MDQNETELPSKRSNGVETASRILEVAIEEMERSGPARFNLDRVIEKSQISRGSVYHHYGNREGLIMAVELRRLESTLSENDQIARSLLRTIDSADEAFSIIEMGVRSAAWTQQREIRMRRFASFAASEHLPALRQSLKRMQLRAVEEFSQTLRLAKDHGFIDPIEPVEGIAHFVQSFLLGRMLVDILEDGEVDEQWHTAAIVALRALLRPQVTPTIP